MNLRSLWSRIFLALRFASRHPWRVLATPLPAIVFNLWILWNRFRGFRILLWYVDHEEYLPFVRPIWERLPDGLAANVKLILVARPETASAISKVTHDWSPKPTCVTTSWISSLVVVYDLFLTTHPTSIVPLRRSGPRICTFHGLPAKGGAFSPKQWKFLDGAFLLGPLHRSLFEELKDSSHEFRRLQGWNIGYPKSDAIIRHGFDRKQISEALTLPYRRSLLYAPTWEDHGSLRAEGVAIIRQLCEWGERVGVNILVKLHPMSSYPTSNVLATGGVDWTETLKAFKRYRCFRHLTESDLGSALSLADVLLSDFSSATLEAVLQDIPIVLLDTPRLIDEVFPVLHGIEPRVARQDPRHNCGRDAAIVLSDRSELLATIQKVFADPETNAVERAQLRSNLLFNQGNASRVAAEFILARLGQCDPERAAADSTSSCRSNDHRTSRTHCPDERGLAANESF